jgi:hypothetical protein
MGKKPAKQSTAAKTPLATSVRFEPHVKAALTKAAKDDARSVSSLITKLVMDWLKANSYLK